MKPVHRTIWSRLLLALGLVFVLAVGSVQTARALEVNKTGTVAEGTVIDDDLVLANDIVDMAGTVNGTLIAAGSDVTVRGTVNGDVIAVGANVTITGTVKGNLFAAGGNITVNGTVENSLFFAGSTLVLGPNAKVDSNLYAAGFSAEIQSGASIGRDAASAGYQILMDGTIGRDLNAGAGALEVKGTVGRNISVDIGEPSKDTNQAQAMQFMPFPHVTRILPPGLSIASTAKIGGKLDYSSAVDQSSGIKATPEGGVTYHYRPPQDNTNGREVTINIQPRGWSFAAFFLEYAFAAIREFLTLVLLSALAVWLCPKLLSRTAGMLRDKPLPSLGWGFLVLVVGIVALVLASITILLLGLAIGVVTLFGLMGVVFGIGFSAVGLSGAIFLALAQFGSKLVVAMLIGDVLFRLIRKDYSASMFWPLLVGVLLLTLVNAIPIFGILVSLFAILFGSGAIWLVFRDWWLKRKSTA